MPKLIAMMALLLVATSITAGCADTVTGLGRPSHDPPTSAALQAQLIDSNDLSTGWTVLPNPQPSDNPASCLANLPVFPIAATAQIGLEQSKIGPAVGEVVSYFYASGAAQRYSAVTAALDRCRQLSLPNANGTTLEAGVTRIRISAATATASSAYLMQLSYQGTQTSYFNAVVLKDNELMSLTYLNPPSVDGDAGFVKIVDMSTRKLTG